MPYNPATTSRCSLSGDDGDVLRGYWEQLSGTGTVSVPSKQMWGVNSRPPVQTLKFGISRLRVNIQGWS